MEALRDRVSVSEIESIGPQQNLFVWYVTFKTPEAQQKVLRQGRLLINHVETTPLSMNLNEVNVRIHWLPYNVHNELLANSLAFYGDVVRIDYERETHDKELAHIRTNVRSVVMRFDSQEAFKQLPHLMNVYGKPILLTCKGRPPICLKCKEEGHIRAKCETPYCRICGDFGHAPEDCDTRKTYLKALTQRSREEKVDEEMMLDPEEEEEDDDEEEENDKEKEEKEEKQQKEGKEEKKKEDDENEKRLFIDTDTEEDTEEERRKEHRKEKTRHS